MYQVSEGFDNSILGNSRTFLVRMEVSGEEIHPQIRSIVQSAASNPGEYISIGGTTSASVQVTMIQPGIEMENQELTLYLGLDLDGKQEYVKMGLFTVQKPQCEDGLLTFTAYDRMTSKLGRAYFSELNYPADGKIVLRELSEMSGVPVAGLSALPDGVMIDKLAVISESGVDEDGSPVTTTTYQAPFNGYTYREALGYIAQLYAKFAVINRDGAIELRWYTDVDYTVEASKYYDDLVSTEKSFELGSIECAVGDTTLISGSGTAGIQISNPVMTQEHLDRIYQALKDFTFLPLSLSFFGDMRLDLGDIVKVHDKHGNMIRIPVMSVTQDFDGGLLTEIKSQGRTDAESTSGATKGPMAQALDRVYTDLFLVKEVIGNKANFDYVYAIDAEFKTVKADYGEYKKLVANDFAAANGRIDTLSGDLASYKTVVADNLQAVTARIDTVTGDLASYKTVVAGELQATNAQIGVVSGDLANYKTVVAGELVAAKGWMAEGAIGNAQISNVSANKLGAGTIDTAIVTVAGTDGRLRISDNTIQIKDANRVRVQIGKDASGDYSMSVWDASGKLIWDALGATEDTIQRKIIRDKMVADDAAIQALKIDFQSFDTALTQQGVTISGTVVQVGSKTLNVALSEQTQAITEQGETLTDHATRIAANEREISLRVTSQEYQADKTGMESRLSATESEVAVMGDRISMKVEQTDINKAIDEMRIGGRNLIRKSAYRDTDSYGVKVTYGEDGYITANGVTTSGNSIVLADVRYLTGLSGNYTFGIERQPGDANTYQITLYKNGAYSSTVYIPSDKTSVTFEASGCDFAYISITNNATGKTINTRVRIKLETGTKATAWTPAPEDIDSAIAAVDNKFASYSTTAQTQAAIDLSKSSILTSVSEIYSTKSEVSEVSGKVTSLEAWKAEASQKITKDGIIQTVGNYYAYESDLTKAESRITTAESRITQQAEQISLRVEKAGVISAINQTAEEVKIDASKINLSGYVTMTNLATSGQTTINGGNITTGLVSADRIDVGGIFAKDITATGTIRGVKLVGGSITTSDTSVGNLYIEKGYLRVISVDQTMAAFVTGGRFQATMRFGGENYCMTDIDGTSISIRDNGEVIFSVDADGYVTANKVNAITIYEDGGTPLSQKYVLKTYIDKTITADGGIQLPNTATNWLGGMTTTKCLVGSPYTSSGDTYHPIIRQNTVFGNVFNLGGMSVSSADDRFGVYIFKYGRTENGYDYSTYWNAATGTLCHDAAIYARGTITSAAEFISTSANGYRIAYGDYGFFIRNDGANTYFMLTAAGDSLGTFNTLRPLYINNISGDVTAGQNIHVVNNRHLYFKDSAGTDRSMANWNSANTVHFATGSYDGKVGNVYYNGNNVYIRSQNGIYHNKALTNNSDERLKTDFAEVSEKLVDAYMDIHPTIFRWKSGGKLQVGVKAQDVIRAMEKNGLNYRDYDMVSQYESEEYGFSPYAVAYEHLDMVTMLLTQQNVRAIEGHDHRLSDCENRMFEISAKAAEREAGTLSQIAQLKAEMAAYKRQTEAKLLEMAARLQQLQASA